MKAFTAMMALVLASGVPGTLAAQTRAAKPETARGPAKADLTRFDGRWSVEVITENGTCDKAYRYAIAIENGQPRYAGGNDFTVTGKIAPNGAVQGLISRGEDGAKVVGRFEDDFASGTWTAGGARSCSGRWNAERRG